MLKKLVDKRIETFKSSFPEYQVSKNGNLYYRSGVQEISRKVKVGDYSVTKNTINKIGVTSEWKEQIAKEVVLITKKGKLMRRDNKNRFTNLSLGRITKLYDNRQKLLDIWLIGRKYEWMKDCPKLMEFKFFQSFSSLCEAKVFLGYSFLSDADFYSLFDLDKRIPLMSILIRAKEKKNAVSLIKSLDYDDCNILRDYFKICEDREMDIEIPAGKNRLRELHDNAVWEARKEDAENFSKLEVYKGKDCKFEEIWTERGLKFERINSPYSMYLTGAKQSHCLGTNYYNQLHTYSFYTIFWDEKEYQIQISQSGEIYQFYGFRNSHAPIELKELTENIDYKHSIEKVLEYKHTEYPKISGEKKGIDDVLEEEDYNLPW